MPRPFGRDGFNDRNQCKTVRLPRERRPRTATAPEPVGEVDTTPPPSPGALERDAELATQGVPICPQCGERTRVIRQLGNWWCNRCTGFLAAGTHLISNPSESRTMSKKPSQPKPPAALHSGQIFNLAPGKIRPSPTNPRKHFDELALAEQERLGTRGVSGFTPPANGKARKKAKVAHA